MRLDHWLGALLIAGITLFSVGMIAHDYEKHVENMAHISCERRS